MNSIPITIVSTFYSSPGGISRFVNAVVRETGLIGHPTQILSPDITRLVEGGSPLADRFPRRLTAFFSLLRLLMRKRPAFLQCHCSWYLLFACAIYKGIMTSVGSRVRLITVKHSDICLPKNSLKKQFLQFLDNRADCVVYVSSYLRAKYFDEFGFNLRVPSCVISPGVSAPNYQPDVVQSIASAIDVLSHRHVMTYIGVFEYEGKVAGLEILIEAMELVRRAYPDAILVIAGDGRLRSRVEKRIELTASKGHVFLIGYLDNPFNLLRLSSLHCHITLQDNFSLVVLEALRAGKPVLASKHGELPNLKIPGLRTTDTDSKHVAVSIIEMLSYPPNVDPFYVEKKYSWRNTATRLASLTIGSMGHV